MKLKHRPLPTEELRRLFERGGPTGLVEKTKRGIGNHIKHPGDPVGCLTPAGYWVARINGRNYQSHRICYFLDTGVDPGPLEIDHRDGVGTNNDADNLRLATHAENGRNVRKPKNNKSGVKGVFLLANGKYLAFITIAQKRIHLGHFPTINEAIAVRRRAEAEHFGEFNRMEIAS
jgi:HNH endonuclease